MIVHGHHDSSGGVFGSEQVGGKEEILFRGNEQTLAANPLDHGPLQGFGGQRPEERFVVRV